MFQNKLLLMCSGAFLVAFGTISPPLAHATEPDPPADADPSADASSAAEGADAQLPAWLRGPEADAPDADHRGPHVDGARRKLRTPPPPPKERARPLPWPTWPASSTTPVTTVDGDGLRAYGAATLTDAVRDLGVWVQRAHPLLPQLTLRGADGWQRSTFGPIDGAQSNVVVDDVPVLAFSTQPHVAPLALLPLSEVQHLQLTRGAQLSVHNARADGGTLALTTVTPPVDADAGLPIGGSAFGHLGGAGLEKGAGGHLSASWLRVRTRVYGEVFHVENRSRGRGADDPQIDFTYGMRGHLGGRVDFAPLPHLQLFGTWQSARMANVPIADLCSRTSSGRTSDCVHIEELGRDAFVVGANAHLPVGAFRLQTKLRAHAQRILDVTQHVGATVVTIEQARTDVLRGGTVGHFALVSPTWTLLQAPLHGHVQLSVADTTDAVVSEYRSRSQRFSDGALREGFGALTEGNGALLNDSRQSRRSAQLSTSASWGILSWTASAQLAQLHTLLPVVDTRTTEPIDDVRVLGSVSTSARVTFPWLTWHVALARLHDGPTLLGYSQGLELAAHRRMRLLGMSPSGTLVQNAVAAPDTVPDFTSHSVESGVVWRGWGWTADARAYALTRSGRQAWVPVDNATSAAWQVLPEQRVAGVFTQLHWQTPLDGVDASAQVRIEAVDEVVERVVSGEATWMSLPSSQGTAPRGRFRLRYRSPSETFSMWTQVRAQAPFNRLSLAEREDTLLCPELPGDLLSPCRGMDGAMVVDVGVRLQAFGDITVDGVVHNVLNQPVVWVNDPLPEGGLAGRLLVRLAF